MKKIVLGFVGELSSGKGTAVAYLKEKYGANTYSFSTMLRDILDRIYVEHKRDNMIDLSVFLRERFGEDTMAKTMAKDVQNDKTDIVAIEGIRRPADIEYLRKLPNFILVEITADQKTRFDRLKKRNQNPDDQTKTWEEFLADAKKPTEISIRDVAKQATIHIDNNGGLENLYEQLDEIVRRQRMSVERSIH